MPDPTAAIDICGPLVFWNNVVWRRGVGTTIRRCGPLVARHEDGSVSVVLGSPFDRACPPDEKGKLLALTRDQWSFDE